VATVSGPALFRPVVAVLDRLQQTTTPHIHVRAQVAADWQEVRELVELLDAQAVRLLAELAELRRRASYPPDFQG
jgi:hypothetical protein